MVPRTITDLELEFRGAHFPLLPPPLFLFLLPLHFLLPKYSSFIVENCRRVGAPWLHHCSRKLKVLCNCIFNVMKTSYMEGWGGQ